MKYNVIVADFDGTLLRSDGTIPASTVQVINELRAQGGIFMISTGRAVNSILPHLQKMGLSGYVACCQGSVLCDIETGKMTYCEGYPADKAAELCKELEKENLDILYFANGVPYIAKHTPMLEYYDSVAGVPSIVVGKPISQFIAETGYVMNKVCTVQSSEETERLYQKYKGTIPNITVSTSETFILEFADSRYNKGTSLSKIREILPDPNAKIITMGDSLIDVSLLEAADLGVAVGNARQEVKDVADLITVSNDENAVEYIIRHYMLEEQA